MDPKSQNMLIVRRNTTSDYRHLYYWLLTMPWLWFVGVFFSAFVLIHAFFAGLYLLDSSSIQGTQRPFSWWDAFCFSVQSLSTIGYGVLSPNGVYANFLVTIEAFVGLLYGAVLTGCFFAKISRATPQLLFSKQILYYPINGVPNLVMRIANKLDGTLIDVEAAVYARIHDAEQNVFHLLKLELRREKTPTLNMNWMLFHELNQYSPLHDIPVSQWDDKEIQIIVNITGHDSIYQQLIHDQHVYSKSDVLTNHRFVDMINIEDHTLEVDLAKISMVERRSHLEEVKTSSSI